MSPAEIKALAAKTSVTDVKTAAQAFGFSRARAYELVVNGQFPCSVLRAGRRYLVPTAGICAALHLDPPDVDE